MTTSQILEEFDNLPIQSLTRSKLRVWLNNRLLELSTTVANEARQNYQQQHYKTSKDDAQKIAEISKILGCIGQPQG